MALRRKKHHRMPARGRFGRFVKGASRRAKRRALHLKSTQHRRRRRRRKNPSVIMANHSAHRRHHAMPIKRRRRRRHSRAHRMPVRTRRRRRTNPHRRHLRAHGRRRLRRRGNPLRLSLRGLWQIAKLALAGGAGVVTARVGAYFYTKYVADHVKGDEGKKDPKSLRALFSDVLRIVAMGGSVVLVHAGLKKVRMLGDTSRTAFLYGGLGESGRQLVGVAVKRFRPSSNLDAFGLSGDLVQGNDGRRYLVTDEGAYYDLDGNQLPMGLTDKGSFGQLVDGDYFAGLMDVDAFRAAELELEAA